MPFRFWNEPKAHDAYYLSIISLFVTVAAGIMGLVLWKKLDDSLLFVYGLENCVDFISSAIVVWRFHKPKQKSGGDMAVKLRNKAILEAREKRANVAISFVLVLLGFGTVIVAIEDLVQGDEVSDDEHLWLLYYIAFCSIIIFGGLSLFKFRYAAVLKSPSLQKDGLCSLLGAILALSLFFNTVLDLATNGMLWWLDPSAAVIAGIVCLIYGLYSIYIPYVREGLPIFKWQWWTYAAKEAIMTSGTANATSTTNNIPSGMNTDDAEEATVVARGDGGGGGLMMDEDDQLQMMEEPLSTTTDEPLASQQPPSSSIASPLPPPMKAFESGNALNQVENDSEDVAAVADTTTTATNKVDITDVELT